jgi:DNA-binding transcriptional ArsR family regulator
MPARTHRKRPQGLISDDRRRAVHLAELMKAIAHPLRIRAISVLCEGEQTVGQLAERLEVSQPILSQQLRILRVHRLVEVRREGGFARYRIGEPQLFGLVACMEGCASR